MTDVHPSATIIKFFYKVHISKVKEGLKPVENNGVLLCTAPSYFHNFRITAAQSNKTQKQPIPYTAKKKYYYVSFILCSSVPTQRGR